MIRVLTGQRAASSGRTIYDPAITNTEIDDARGLIRSMSATRSTSRSRRRRYSIRLHRTGCVSTAIRSRAINLAAGLSKRTITGGTLGVGVDSLTTRSSAGRTAAQSVHPVVVRHQLHPAPIAGRWLAGKPRADRDAQIETERSFFQLKESVQQMVRGVIEGYWLLRVSQVDVWGATAAGPARRRSL